MLIEEKAIAVKAKIDAMEVTSFETIMVIGAELQEIKDDCQHGEFGGVCDAVGIKATQRSKYLKVWGKISRLENLNFRVHEGKLYADGNKLTNESCWPMMTKTAIYRLTESDVTDEIAEYCLTQALNCSDDAPFTELDVEETIDEFNPESDLPLVEDDEDDEDYDDEDEEGEELFENENTDVAEEKPAKSPFVTLVSDAKKAFKAGADEITQKLTRLVFKSGTPNSTDLKNAWKQADRKEQTKFFHWAETEINKSMGRLFDKTPGLEELVADTAPELGQAIAEWFEYKRTRNEAYKGISVSKQVTMIINASKTHGIARVVEAIDEAIGKQWKGWDRQLREEEKAKNGGGI